MSFKTYEIKMHSNCMIELQRAIRLGAFAAAQREFVALIEHNRGQQTADSAERSLTELDRGIDAIMGVQP